MKVEDIRYLAMKGYTMLGQELARREAMPMCVIGSDSKGTLYFAAPPTDIQPLEVLIEALEELTRSLRATQKASSN